MVYLNDPFSREQPEEIVSSHLHPIPVHSRSRACQRPRRLVHRKVNFDQVRDLDRQPLQYLCPSLSQRSSLSTATVGIVDDSMCEKKSSTSKLVSTTMKYVALLSGGKDSCYNLLHCFKNGHELVATATLGPEEGKGRFPTHIFKFVHLITLEQRSSTRFSIKLLARTQSSLWLAA